MAEEFRIEYMWQYQVLKKHLEEMQAQVQEERGEEERQRLSEIEDAVKLFERTVLKKHEEVVQDNPSLQPVEDDPVGTEREDDGDTDTDADTDVDGNGNGEREEGGEGDGSGG